MDYVDLLPFIHRYGHKINMGSQYQVIDNFLPEDQFEMLRNIMMSYYFPWCYWWGRGEDEITKDFFFHNFYRKGEIQPSGYFNILGPSAQKLVGEGGELIRAKAVLTTQTAEHHNRGFHNDYDDITTAIYYINTNNGWTEFGDGDKVESVANRMLVFDSNLIHGGVSCTDEKTRILINFNYA